MLTEKKIFSSFFESGRVIVMRTCSDSTRDEELPLSSVISTASASPSGRTLLMPVDWAELANSSRLRWPIVVIIVVEA